MLQHGCILQFPDEMPEDGSIGSNPAEYKEYFAKRFVAEDGDNLYGTPSVKKAVWFDDFAEAMRWSRPFPGHKHLLPMRLRIEVG